MSPYSASVLDKKIETGYGQVQVHDENERTNTAAFITCSNLKYYLRSEILFARFSYNCTHGIHFLSRLALSRAVQAPLWSHTLKIKFYLIMPWNIFYN